jgi:hypothetical protein
VAFFNPFNKMRTLLLAMGLLFSVAASAQQFFPADHPGFLYTGRVDFGDKQHPRFWAPGVYIQANFSGTSCEIIVNDEELHGNYHNYVQVVVDGGKQSFRIKTKAKTDTLRVKGLKNGAHRLLICKDTEHGIGYMEFVGLRCEKLLPAPKPAAKTIEFIGNSITCGMGNDEDAFPCGKGDWYDQHNAYLAYGPLSARELKANWVLSSVSGIGLIHSCCNMTIMMPQVFDKINMRTDSIPWDFRFAPDLVTVCLGQNDGIQDSVKFCSAYVDFVNRLHDYYPNAKILCLTSPMADAKLAPVQKNYLNGIMEHFKKEKFLFKYFFSRRWTAGCTDHPSKAEHQMIAKELITAIRQQKLLF